MFDFVQQLLNFGLVLGLGRFNSFEVVDGIETLLESLLELSDVVLDDFVGWIHFCKSH